MAYGVTSQSLLLAIGIAPALASAAVHIAEVGTTAASGASHWRFGNIDWDKVRPLAIPGAIGAFLGAVVISRFITAEAAEPLVAIFLFSLGVYILARFSFRRHQTPVNVRPISARFLSPLGFVAGFLDAMGGGGWGPISTPTSALQRQNGAAQDHRHRRLPASSWCYGGEHRLPESTFGFADIPCGRRRPAPRRASIAAALSPPTSSGILPAASSAPRSAASSSSPT
jgi:hypothetical protein